MPIFNVAYDKTTNIDELLSNLSLQNATVVKHLQNIRLLTVECSTAEHISALPGVIAVDADGDITPNLATDIWHKLRVCSSSLPMRDTYITKNLGDAVVVYLVDSGITLSEELNEATIENLYSFSDTYTDDINHGTALAALIAGKTLGVSPKCIVKNVKIAMNTTMPVSELLTAFDAILADHTTGVSVVNCSWVVAKNQILDLKIQELQDEGLIVVAAAGNDVLAANDFSPVGLDTVMGVAAADSFDRVINWGPSSGSNWGPEVDITAPGIDVSVLSNTGQIVESSGTSLAAAITSGAMAQFVKEHPTFTANQIKAEVISKGLHDLLFRNESIYGTTPNVLLRCPTPEAATIFDGTPASADAKKGVTTTVTIVHTDDVSEITINDIVINGTLRRCFDWVAITGNTLQFTPPADFPSAAYVVMYSGKNSSSQQIAYGVMLVNVFTHDVAELSSGEKYFTVEENGVVIVKPASCVFYASCPNGNECFDDGKGGSCICSGGGCVDA